MSLTLELVARASFAEDADAAPPPDAPPSSPPDARPPSAEPSPAPDAAATPDVPPPNEPPAPPETPPPPADGNLAPSTGSAEFAPLPPAPSIRQPTRVDAPPNTQPAAAPEPTPGGGAQHGASSESPTDAQDSNGLFGPFRIGLFVGGGLPDLLSLGGALKLTRYLGAGINVGLIPAVKISFYGDATLAFQEYDAYGRVYPFGGALFLGAGIGYARVHGTLASHFDLSSYQKMYPDAGIPPSLDVSSQASVRTLVLTPQVGLLHTFESGFSIGADVGAQVPIAPSQVDFATQIPASIPAAFKAQIETQYVDPNDAKVRASLDKIGRAAIPTFNIKIGWLL